MEDAATGRSLRLVFAIVAGIAAIALGAVLFRARQASSGTVELAHLAPIVVTNDGVGRLGKPLNGPSEIDPRILSQTPTTILAGTHSFPNRYLKAVAPGTLVLSPGDKVEAYRPLETKESYDRQMQWYGGRGLRRLAGLGPPPVDYYYARQDIHYLPDHVLADKKSTDSAAGEATRQPE